MTSRLLLGAFVTTLLAAQSLEAQNAALRHTPTLAQQLKANRHSLTVGPMGLGGDGAGLVAQAVRGARIVALGEDHLTREVPAFASALCDLMSPQHLAAVVLEAGPAATREVAATFKMPDRLKRMVAFNAHYPNAIAFLDTRADYEFAAHCASVTRNPHFRTIGIDQEFAGSAGFLIDKILATRLSAAARREIEALRADEVRRATAAKAGGDPSALLMLAISDEQLNRAQAALDKGGNPAARDLFASLRISHEIYAKNATGAPDSNRARALLMKRSFALAVPTRGKILMKFGDWHLYRGVNPLGERDIGNYVAEMTEGEGDTSLHILMLGSSGVHALFGGYAKPLRREPFKMAEDKDYHWLQTAIREASASGWTLFDLRPLRHVTIAELDADWRRVIDGYDLLVLVPELTPSDTIGLGQGR